MSISQSNIGAIRRVHFATTKHGAICGLRGSNYTSSAHARNVNCPKCLEVMKANAARNLEMAGLLP